MKSKTILIILAVAIFASCQKKVEGTKKAEVISLDEAQSLERWVVGDSDVRKAASEYAKRAGWEVKGVSIEFDKDERAAAYTAYVDCKKGSEEQILTVTVLAFADEGGKIYWKAVQEAKK